LRFLKSIVPSGVVQTYSKPASTSCLAFSVVLAAAEGIFPFQNLRVALDEG
jgi:hypothetical protein